MIRYLDSASEIEASQLQGFFVGWPEPPSPETHLRLLQNSDEIVVAVDEADGNVIAFITAITDRVLAAYIPFLEVLPAYQHQGIGSELLRRLLQKLEQFYMIDLLCDLEVQTFYEVAGMQRSSGMMIRNYHRQKGED